MSVSIVNGFDVPKIQSLEISNDDIKKLGIKPEDFSKVDKNQDGRITYDEFLSSGINYSSIYNAYKGMALEEKGYLEGDALRIAQETGNIDDPEKTANNQGMQNPYATRNLAANNNLNHPAVTNPALANKFDYMA